MQTYIRDGVRSCPTMEFTMLILTVKEDDKILIGDNVSILVVEINGRQVKLGITAPPDVKVSRFGVSKVKGQA